MSKQLRAWTATPAETRAAWIVASLSIVLVIVSFLWPLMKDGYSDNVGISTQKRVSDTKSIEKIIANVRQEEIHKVKTRPEKKKISRPAPAPKRTAPVAAQKSRQKTASATLPKGYYVQTGAFKERKRAEALQKRLAANWKTHTKVKPGNIIAVWAGPYKSSKEANRIKAEIASRAKIKGFIIKN
jgi:cell division septation protein DedD